MSRRKLSGYSRRTSVTIPERVGPHVKLVFAEMRRQNRTYDDVEEGSGVRRVALKAWRHKNYPSLTSLEAVFGFLGYDLVPIPRSRVLPQALVAKLEAIAEEHALEMPATVQALVEVVAGIHDKFGTAPPGTVVEVPYRRIPKAAT
jgi:hypothetical protein